MNHLKCNQVVFPLRPRSKESAVAYSIGKVNEIWF
mgnify:CR=1 FL=1